MNYDPRNVIRVGTDLRFVDQSRPWDKVMIISVERLMCLLIYTSAGINITNLTMECRVLVVRHFTQ
jgi:hypothetical protein